MRIILLAIVLSLTAFNANAEIKFRNLIVSQDISNTCALIAGVITRKHKFLDQAQQHETNWLDCHATTPSCAQEKVLLAKINETSKHIALETAKIRLLDSRSISFSVDFYDAEMHVFHPGKPESTLTNEIEIAVDYFGQRTIKKLTKSDEAEIIPFILYKLISRNKSILEGPASQFCALASNSGKRLFSVKTAPTSTRLSGVDFDDVQFTFNVFLGPQIPADTYPSFDWVTLVTPMLDNLFGSLVPASQTLSEIASECDKFEREDFVKFIRRARFAIRSKNMLGAPSSIFEKSKIEFIGGSRRIAPALKLSLPLDDHDSGLYLEFSRDSAVSLAGYFDKRPKNLCS